MSETTPAADAAAAQNAVPFRAGPFKYEAALAADIEARWQDRWEREGTFEAPNPGGGELGGPARSTDRPKKFIMDMFPYPSGAGLHVGHPLGYIATDVYARYQRMTGHNVLHTLGFDAFGLPAEQYAVQTGTHPRVTTEANIVTMRGQLRRLGLGHDSRRSFATIDPELLPLDPVDLPADLQLLVRPARPAGPGRSPSWSREFASGARPTPDGRAWDALTAAERADVLGGYRLAYASDSPVNWCPGLGTVLANEEVTADGRSERGNFPVFKAKLRQWKMRITAYADRLLDDLDALDWPEAIKPQQRNWIGRSEGARVDFPVRVQGDGDAMVDGLHHPPGHAVRRHLHGAGPRARPGRRHRPGRLARRHPPGVDRRPRHARRGGRRVPQAGRRQVRRGAPGGGQGQDRRLHRRLRDQPGQRAKRSRSSSPTTS